MAIPIIIPKQGQSVETCILVQWFVQKGEPVSKGDLLYTFETDKSSFDEEAPEDGILLDIFYNAGDEVPVLSTVAVIGQKGEDITKLKMEDGKLKIEDGQKKSEVVSHKAELQSPISELRTPNLSAGRQGSELQTTKISPRAARLAAKMNININSLKGSGPGGRIIESDIEQVSSSKTQDTSSKTQVARQEIKEVASGDWEIKKLSNIRQIISRNIYESLQNSAQLTHHSSADASRIIDYRNKIKKLQETNGIGNITLNDLVCFALIKALKAKPEINSHFLGDSVKNFSKVHLGFAVDTERGLMVPVIRNADDMDIKELSAQFKSLADKCREGKIDPELTNSTAASFTVSNLGAYGVEIFTPILNLPQAGILGIDTIVNRPAYNKKKIEIIPYIGLSLTYDHRAIDGAPASAFLKEVKEQIENIEISL